MLIRKLKTEKEYEIVIGRRIQWSSDKMELFPKVPGKSHLSHVLFLGRMFHSKKGIYFSMKIGNLFL